MKRRRNRRKALALAALAGAGFLLGASGIAS
jgi:hypothetical protein